jgi:tripartite-type tricarboxylate transporter receptor subunit TctC
MVYHILHAFFTQPRTGVSRMKRLAFSCLLFFSLQGLAQTYPSRPIRLVVPLSPGGFADTPARMLAPRLSDQLGKPVFVENRPGAGGSIGADFVAKSAPDGHTLVITGRHAPDQRASLQETAYDALKDFTHITMLASGRMCWW